MKQSQWNGFLGRSGRSADLQLTEVVAAIRQRLAPLIGLKA